LGLFWQVQEKLRVNAFSAVCFSYVPSQADAVVFDSMSGAPDSNLHHALRWYNHILSYGAEKSSFPGDKEGAKKHIGATPAKAESQKKDDDDDDDDDDDLFGSESVSDLNIFSYIIAQ